MPDTRHELQQREERGQKAGAVERPRPTGRTIRPQVRLAEEAPRRIEPREREQVRRAARDLQVMAEDLRLMYRDRLGARSAEALAVMVAVAVEQLTYKAEVLRAAASAYPNRRLGGEVGGGDDDTRDGQQVARLRLLTVAISVSRPIRRLLEILDNAE